MQAVIPVMQAAGRRDDYQYFQRGRPYSCALHARLQRDKVCHECHRQSCGRGIEEKRHSCADRLSRDMCGRTLAKTRSRAGTETGAAGVGERNYCRTGGSRHDAGISEEKAGSHRALVDASAGRSSISYFREWWSGECGGWRNNSRNQGSCIILGNAQDYPSSASIASISDCACRFPVRRADAMPSVSIIFGVGSPVGPHQRLRRHKVTRSVVGMAFNKIREFRQRAVQIALRWNIPWRVHSGRKYRSGDCVRIVVEMLRCGPWRLRVPAIL